MLMSIICNFLNLLILIQAFRLRGDGIWSVIDISLCDAEIENAVLTFTVEKYKANRTHVAFRGEINNTMDVDDTFMLEIHICQYVDGGCKHYMTVVDGMKSSLYRLSRKNTESLLRSGGIDPPKFPIPKGHHIVDDYIVDYCELPTMRCAYGKYEAEVFFVKDNKKVGCLKYATEFLRPEEGICD